MRSLPYLLPIFALLLPPSACSSSSPQAPAGACRADALVVVSDYASSGVGHFALDGTGYLQFGSDLAADPALAVSHGRAFYVARDLGKIYELDAHCGSPTGVVFEANDPARPGSANPQDVAVAPDGTLWIPRYNVPSVVVLSPKGDAVHTIDLSSYAPDGNPDATAIDIESVRGASKAFVALERLDNTKSIPEPYPDLPSQVLRIDVATATPEGTTDLIGRNPFGTFVPFGGALYFAEPGNFQNASEALAGIERFDPPTSTSALLVKETDLGGSVAQVALTAGCGAAVIADPSPKNRTSLVTFDPKTGAAITNAASPVLGPTSGFDLQAMLWVGSVLIVGDRAASGTGYVVHTFDLIPPCTLRARPDTISLRQPPVAFRAPAP